MYIICFFQIVMESVSFQRTEKLRKFQNPVTNQNSCTYFMLNKSDHFKVSELLDKN